MARARRVARGGPGYFGLIVFIVLCLALIAACAALWTQMAYRQETINKLHRGIRTNLEDPLRAAELPGAESRSTVTSSDPAYDDDFFRVVGDAALDGLKWAKLLKVIGWDVPEQTEAIKEEIDKTGANDLRNHVQRLHREITKQESLYKNTNSKLLEAIREREEFQTLKEQAEKHLSAARVDASDKRAVARRKFTAQLAEMKKLVAQADQNKKKAYGTLKVVEESHKREVGQLKDEKRHLREQLATALAKGGAAAEESEASKPIQGKILNSNLVEGKVSIDLGTREGIEAGDKFNVMRRGKGGVLVRKGEIQISRVTDVVSMGDILSQDPDDTIARGDVVLPQRQPGG